MLFEFVLFMFLLVRMSISIMLRIFYLNSDHLKLLCVTGSYRACMLNVTHICFMHTLAEIDRRQ